MFEVAVILVLNLDHTPRVLSSAHVLCANLYHIHYLAVKGYCTSVHNITYTITLYIIILYNNKGTVGRGRFLYKCTESFYTMALNRSESISCGIVKLTKARGEMLYMCTQYSLYTITHLDEFV